MVRYDVLLIGRTPSAAVLARLLAAADRSVALIDDGSAPSLDGSIRWLMLRDLGLVDQPVVDSWPHIAVYRDRELLEDGFIDMVYRLDRFGDLASRRLITESNELVAALVADSASIDHGVATPHRFLRQRGRVAGVRFADGGEIGARLTIVTSGNRRLLGAKDKSLPDEITPPLFEQLDIVWQAGAGAACELTHLTGGPLAEVEGSAVLQSASGRTALSVVVSAAALVREAVVVSDVLDRLLCHDALVELPPLATAVSATVRLLTRPERVDVDQYGPGLAVLGPIQCFSDPSSFDREVRLSHLLAVALARAPSERYGSVSLLGAIAATLRTSEWARRPSGPVGAGLRLQDHLGCLEIPAK